MRDSDTVSRHGGEEFLVLLPDISQAADAASIAQKLLAALAAPARAGEHRLRLSASVGITIYPEDAEDAQTLISRADAAMYQSKRRGPGGLEFYRAFDDPPARRRQPEPTGATAPTRRRLPETAKARVASLEAGTRFVQMNWPAVANGNPEVDSWDTHAANFTLLRGALPSLDATYSALLEDLDRD